MSATIEQRLLNIGREVAEVASAIWWRFFDWLAVVEWRQLFIIWVIMMIASAPFGRPEPAVWFLFISFSVKVLAGGKRRAEIDARQANAQADLATLERRLTEAQMATLQAQVEPHFLFNTLALIGQLIETDPPQAARIHNHLIDYLRSTLPQMRSTGGGTLGRQVQLSRAYLAIMQARMKERLAVEFTVPDFLGSAPFPPMMLQILIENAIKHGLEPQIAGGTIVVSAQVVDATLQVEVADNGAGFNPRGDEGIGLANIRERLQILYGSEAQLIIEARAGGGTIAAIHLPYRMMEGV
ncbi:MAG: histidine kinase [Massilia sp.]